MTTAIGQQNAGLFSAAAYATIGSTSDAATQSVIALGWHEHATLSQSGTPGSNTQFRVFVNDSTQQVVIALKGSNTINDFKSDLLNSGASQYAYIQEQAQQALSDINSKRSPQSEVGRQ